MAECCICASTLECLDSGQISILRIQANIHLLLVSVITIWTHHLYLYCCWIFEYISIISRAIKFFLSWFLTAYIWVFAFTYALGSCLLLGFWCYNTDQQHNKNCNDQKSYYWLVLIDIMPYHTVHWFVMRRYSFLYWANIAIVYNSIKQYYGSISQYPADFSFYPYWWFFYLW